MERLRDHRLTSAISDRDHAQGPADAPLTLVMYGDFECPYTRRARPIVHRLRQEFGDRLRYAFRNFPLAQVHPHAQHASEAAEAAAMQGKFWEMYDVLFEHQHHLEDTDLARYAEQVGLEPARFEREVAGHVHARRINEDVQSGLESGVEGTPTFFINGLRHDGSYDLTTLLAAIEEAEPSKKATWQDNSRPTTTA